MLAFFGAPGGVIRALILSSLMSDRASCLAAFSIFMNKWIFGICAFHCLRFFLPAKPCSHPGDRMAGEMYLLTSINIAVL